MTDNIQSSDLTSQAMDVVTALTNVEVPVRGAVAEASDKSDSERAAKWVRRKERMLCYRCGEKGHWQSYVTRVASQHILRKSAHFF